MVISHVVRMLPYASAAKSQPIRFLPMNLIHSPSPPLPPAALLRRPRHTSTLNQHASTHTQKSRFHLLCGEDDELALQAGGVLAEVVVVAEVICRKRDRWLL